MLKNASFLAVVAVRTAENEPSKVCRRRRRRCLTIFNENGDPKPYMKLKDCDAPPHKSA